MATRTVMVNGEPITDVPESMTNEEVFARVAERDRKAELGSPIEQIRKQLAEQTGPVQTALIMASQFLANRRVPGIDQIPPGITEALQEESPVSSFIGEAAFPTLAAIAAPPSLLAQGGVQAGLEAVREGATPLSTGAAGAFGAVGQASGDFLSRFLPGAVSAGVAKLRGTPEQIRATLGQRLLSEGDTFGAGIMRRIEAVLESFGGLDDLAQSNQRAFNRSVAESFGETLDETAKITPQVLRRAQERLGAVFDSITPKSLKLDTRTLQTEWKEVFSNLGSKARSIGGKDFPDVINGQQYTNLRRAISDRASKLARSDAAAADDLIEFVNQMDEVLNIHIGDDVKPVLRAAREAYKNLKLTESIPEVVKRGNVSKSGLNQRLTAGYGTSFIQDTQKVLPETQGMFNTLREINQLNPVIGDSGSALRAIGGAKPIMALANLAVSPIVGQGLAIAGGPGVASSASARAAAIAAGEFQRQTGAFTTDDTGNQ